MCRVDSNCFVSPSASHRTYANRTIWPRISIVAVTYVVLIAAALAGAQVWTHCPCAVQAKRQYDCAQQPQSGHKHAGDQPSGPQTPHGPSHRSARRKSAANPRPHLSRTARYGPVERGSTNKGIATRTLFTVEYLRVPVGVLSPCKYIRTR